MERDASAEDLFSTLGSETRVDILRVLSDADASLPFSDLQQRVGLKDSGQFNYHLNKVVGSFVRQTDDGTYELSYAGGRVVGAIYSGELERNVTVEPFRLDSKCWNCDTPIVAEYEDEVVTIACPDCERANCRFWFPPHGLRDRSPAELTNVFDRWLRHRYPLKLHGICDNCTGNINAAIVDDAEFKHPEDPACIEYECERCPEDALLSFSSFLTMHPTVISFAITKGVDVTSVESWNVRSVLDPTIDVLSTEPWKLDVTFRVADEVQTATLSENLSLTLQ